jgi:hypothetical protein
LEKSKLEKFNLLLQFMNGDRRIPDAFRWGLSIHNKRIAMEILYREVVAQIPKCSCEMKQAEEGSQGIYRECIILAIKYEVFLNSIYSLCENLSNVVRYLYPSKNLPQHFREQKSRLLQDQSIDPDYTGVLSSTRWYDEIHGMRSETTHYLSGLIVISSSTKLGYFNVPKGTRKDSPKDIRIQDIEGHIEQVHSDVLTFLNLFGNHFIKVIDRENQIPQVCQSISMKIIGARRISLREHLNHESGICLTTKNPCPERDSCEAYIKAKK